jgi:hypothetical protein
MPAIHIQVFGEHVVARNIPVFAHFRTMCWTAGRPRCQPGCGSIDKWIGPGDGSDESTGKAIIDPGTANRAARRQASSKQDHPHVVAEFKPLLSPFCYAISAGRSRR